MEYKIVYFTRTGNSERIAKKIAAKISCERIKITDNMNWEGAIGFLKGGYYASKKKDVRIELNKDIGIYDELIVICPLWAGGLPPAVKMFFKSIPAEKVNLVITSKGSMINDRRGYKSVSDIVESKNNEDDVINNLVGNLL